QSLLSDARSFAQDISHFQTGTVTNMNLMLSNTYALKNLDFSKWVFNLNVTLTSFVANSGLNPTSYDSLLIRLDGTDFTGRTAAKALGATLVKYSSAGAAARASLITKGWTITDGGQA